MPKSDILTRIKRLALAGRLEFTEKADIEMYRDHISEDMVREALISADFILKTVRSTYPHSRKVEQLHIIVGKSWSGLVIYTKGRFEYRNGEETFYILISSKRFLD